MYNEGFLVTNSFRIYSRDDEYIMIKCDDIHINIKHQNTIREKSNTEQKLTTEKETKQSSYTTVMIVRKELTLGDESHLRSHLHAIYMVRVGIILWRMKEV